MSSISATSSALDQTTAVTGTLSRSVVAGSTIGNASTTLTKLQDDLATVSTRISNYGSTQAALQALELLSRGLRNGTQVGGLTATSNSSLVTATLGNNAVAGTYTVNVSRLAQAQVNTSSSSATATSAAAKGTGTLAIAVGKGAAVNVSIANTMSLTDIVNAINNANAGVTAQLSGSTGSNTVTVTGNNTGAANAVTYTESGTTLGLANTQNQAALDSSYTINGTSYSSTYNTAAYGIPGTVMSLLGLANNAVITVGANAAAVQSAITNFATGYNNVVSALSAAFATPQSASDPILRTILKQMSRVIGNASSGASGAYNSLASVGVTLNSDGTLAVNTNVLSAATTNSAGSVARLISGTSTGTNGLAANLYSIAQTFAEPGVGGFGRAGFRQARSVLDLNRSINKQQSIVDSTTNTVAKQYTNLQVALSQLNAKSLLVQGLTAEVGISASS